MKYRSNVIVFGKLGIILYKNDFSSININRINTITDNEYLDKC